MKISIISGSHRNPSQSEKIASLVEKTLQQKPDAIEPYVFKLADNPLPLWDEGVWNKEPHWEELLTPIKKQFSESDAFVIITPEWHGQVPSGLKNLFLLMSRFEMGHKPAFIISVSSGDGGAYPVAELRMSSYKNNRLCYIPEQLIIRHVENVLNDDGKDNDPRSDSYYRERLDWCLDLLIAYGKALKPLREQAPIFHDKFGNGM